jgi:uridine kinase
MKTYMIGIAGSVEQVKVFSRNLATLLGEHASIIFEESYAKNNILFFDHLIRIKNKESIDVPEFGFFSPTTFVIVDGPTCLSQQEIKNIFDLKIFIGNKEEFLQADKVYSDSRNLAAGVDEIFRLLTDF